MCSCGHGLAAMASAASPVLQLQRNRLCTLPSSIAPPLPSSRFLHSPNSARCLRGITDSRTRISSPLLATPREDAALEHHAESSTNGAALRASLECVERVSQGGGSELETLALSHGSSTNGSIPKGGENANGSLPVVERRELDWVAMGSGRQLVEEFLFTQDYLDSLDYDSFDSTGGVEGAAVVDMNGSFAETVTVKVNSVITEERSRKKSVKSLQKGSRVLPSTILELLPLKLETNIKFYIDVYASMLKAGRIKDCLKLLGEMDKAGKLARMKVNHSKFYEACKARGSVEDAFAFAKLMREFSTLQHYTMLLSVCCHAKDIDGALRVLALLESRGLKADCMFYTSLISACAKAGKVDLLFQIFHEMEVAGIEANVHTFGAMIDGCARAGQLPKAFGAYGIMISKNVKPDRVIFNTLINACTRAGAVQRAFDVLTDMKAEATPIKPDHVTYGALISACARAGEVDRALEVYQNMRESNVKGSPACYTAVVHACSQKGNVDYALLVYDDLKKDGVKPDEVFFSALVDAAGHAQDIEKAFSIIANMKEEGLKPGAVVYSSLMGVCSNLGNWEKALEVYQDIRSSGLQPTVSTFNALMTALCEANQFTRALSILQDVKNSGIMPNQISYSILLRACEKEKMADMALDLYMTALSEGIKPNVGICDSITGLCLQQIQSYAAAPQKLWSMLPVPADSNNLSSTDQWSTWALSVYRQTIEAGTPPKIETLSQLLGCLRKLETSTKALTTFDDRTIMAFLGQPQVSKSSTPYDGFGIYDPRALALFEEASALKIVPTISSSSVQPIVINAEMMPVFAAEVCILTILKGLKHRHAAGARVPGVTIKLHTEKKEFYRTKGGLLSMTMADKTGQAVAALLRRLGLKAQGSESTGELRLTVLEIQKWLKPKPIQTETMKTPFAPPEKAFTPYSLLAKTIADQQRAIRLGTVAPHNRVLDVMTDMDLKDGLIHSEQGFSMFGANMGPKRSVKGSRRRSSSF